MAGDGTQTLFTPPDAKKKPLEIERKIKFRMKSVPTGEKSAGGVVFEGDKKTD